MAFYPYACPVCGEPLKKEDGYVCVNNHRFDVAKSGYVNLILPNQKHSFDPGDNKEMIKARRVIMEKGYYARLADGICSLLENDEPTSLLDAGCGIGYIPYRLKDAFPKASVLGADISKFAIDCAAKLYKDIPFAVASSNRLPLADDTVDGLVCAFAPVFATEFSRVLKQGGSFIRVTPGERHLFGLKEKLYETPYLNELDPIEIEGFTFIKSVQVEDEITLNGAEEIESLVKMTPYYYHTAPSAIAALCELPTLTTRLVFEVRKYKLS